jgi:hypothetical protein
MRTLLLAGLAIVSLAGSMPAQAADIYEPAPGYGAAPPVYGPPAAAVPGFVEAPPPRYAPLPPPVAYPPAPRYRYGAEGYGPQPGWVYSGPPVPYDEDVVEAPPPVYRGPPVYAERLHHCWWEWGRQVCAPRRGW